MRMAGQQALLFLHGHAANDRGAFEAGVGGELSAQGKRSEQAATHQQNEPNQCQTTLVMHQPFRGSERALLPAHVVHLHAELPGRHNDDGKWARQRRRAIPARTTRLSQRPLHYRYSIRNSFTAAGLRTPENVEAVAHGAGNDGALDGQGGDETLPSARASDNTFGVNNSSTKSSKNSRRRWWVTCHVVNCGGNAAIKRDALCTPSHRVGVGAGLDRGFHS